MSTRTLKPIFQRGGARRQEILDQAVEMLASRSGPPQGEKMHFCMTEFVLTGELFTKQPHEVHSGFLLEEEWWLALRILPPGVETP